MTHRILRVNQIEAMMSEPDSRSDQKQSDTELQQATVPSAGKPEVNPKFNAEPPGGTQQGTTYEIHPSTKSDWHKPLGIPITDWFMAVFTLIIMASSILYTVYARRQWKVANATLTEIQNGKADTERIISASEAQADSSFWMEQHTDDATQAIQDSVDTADRNTKRTLRNAENTFRDEQRAWMGVANAVIRQYPTTTSGEFDAVIIFVNSGRTPAVHISHAASVDFYPTVVPEPPKDRDVTPASFIEGGATAPQGQGYIGINNFETTSTVLGETITDTVRRLDPALQNKTLYLYVFGTINYGDVYDRSHSTTFCFYMSDPAKHLFGACPKHNDIH
ncbi:MAG TPA: hypothetical protein VI386_09515 [Candidatus Sulfotelmatobacter sp.]